MQFLLDHIAAAMIAGLLLLVIMATQFAGQQTNIDATQYYDAKIRLLDLVQSVERDFTNIGSGLDSVQFAIQEFDTVSVPARISFAARTDSTIPGWQLVTYQWEETGSVTLKDNSTIPTYTVQRLINGAVSGTSTGSITGFRVDLLRADSISITTNFQDTRLVNVIMSTASTLGTNEQVEQSRWRKQFRPMNMTRAQ